MKNKQHQYILKAFCTAGFPSFLYKYLPEMVSTFELIDIMALDVLKGRRICRPNEDLLTSQEKKKISVYLSSACQDRGQREEMIFFYRLSILVISVLNQYF